MWCIFFPAWRQSVGDQRNNFWGHFPQSCDGSIFKCYVNVITRTEKVLSRSPRRRSKPFMSDEAICIRGSQTLTRTPNKFPELPETVFQRLKRSPYPHQFISASFCLFYDVLRLPVSHCQTFLRIELCCLYLFFCFFFSVFLPACHHCLFYIFYSFTFILRNGL